MVEFQGIQQHFFRQPVGQLSNPGNLLSATARGQGPYPLHIRKYPPFPLPSGVDAVRATTTA